MFNGQIRILTVFVLGNRVSIKYRTTINVEKLLDEGNINVTLFNDAGSLIGRKVKKIGKKTFKVTYYNDMSKKIIDLAIEKGANLSVISSKEESQFKINKIDESMVSYTCIERIQKSKKYSKFCVYIYDRFLKKSIGEENCYLIKSEGNQELNVSKDTRLKYKNDKNFKREVDYATLYENEDLLQNVILYESFHGKSMSDSPYAIFKMLIDDPEYKDFTHVWALNNDENCKGKYRLAQNVEIVKVGSEEYINYLAKSKYLINNTTFPPYFIRKKDQIYLNTWHGTPLKTLGKYMKGTRGQYKNIQRNLLQATHLLNPNKFTADVMIDSHDIRGIYNGYIADIGYPRIDLTINSDKDEIKKELNIDDNKKVILYAPTWRGEVGDVNKEIDRFINDYKTLKNLYSDKYIILLRVHSLMERALKERKMEKFVVPSYIDTNELLAIVDILITDYSSIMFDYMVTKNPIILYCYDREEYEKDRGFLLSLEEMPAAICGDINEVISSINNIDIVEKENREKYKKCIEKYNYNDDGKATCRTIDYIFNNNLNNAYKVIDDKDNILIYCGGFLNNGVTTSAINLLDNINYNKYNVVVIDKGNYNEECDYNISKLNSNVKVLYRVGNMIHLLDEIDKEKAVLNKGLKKQLNEEKEILSLYRREGRRLLGNSKIDVVIDFSGYVPFWSFIFAASNVKRKVIYQHNEMLPEYNKKIDGKYKHRKNLDVIFHLYNNFDVVVSVAEGTCNSNKKNLSYAVENIEKKFVYVNNSINYKNILKLADEEDVVEICENKYYVKEEKINENGIINIECFRKPDKKDIVFINIGRMSPEKDQYKLLKAFKLLCDKYNNVKLYIVGDGILRDDLESSAMELKIKDKVIFTGQIKNPFALLKNSDCFVLSSNHEGQPMVLLENLILDKAIIATDIPGNRSVLENGYGLLCDNSEEGLFEAMDRFVTSGIEHRKFDYIQYNTEAMNMFYSKVLNEEVR
ncbi:putative protein [Clostridium bornimense]|uniref:Glycosyl transferase family 1 domain-containing protein n=1 Tax=Clostridium bornimense TaxID=1216932 RepID=W6RX04_9CLOT|nr:glycosyltransferase [Clostridium bornimense]CDM69211.1 putative protein [Clostridium bornimense]